MTKQQIKQLAQIKSINDIKSLDVTNEYVDDHQQCADVEINGVAVEFLWYDNLGFLDYYDESAKAAAKLLKSIKFIIFAAIEELEPQEMDDELDAIYSQLTQEIA